MSLVKSTQEFRTILDFSKGKLSKNLIKTSLRSAEVLERTSSENSNTVSIVENSIRIGMYQIKLWLSPSLNGRRTKLKEYGGFNILICEYDRNDVPYIINLSRDSRFKDQYWVKLNATSYLRIQNLVDVIMFVKRLNNLKLFL